MLLQMRTSLVRSSGQGRFHGTGLSRRVRDRRRSGEGMAKWIRCGRPIERRDGGNLQEAGPGWPPDLSETDQREVSSLGCDGEGFHHLRGRGLDREGGIVIFKSRGEGGPKGGGTLETKLEHAIQL